jgi:hypothetical protein
MPRASSTRRRAISPDLRHSAAGDVEARLARVPREAPVRIGPARYGSSV